MSARPVALDAFGGQGGTGAGLIAAGFDVEAVDLVDHSARHPGRRFVVGDALDYIAEHGHRYALIVAGVPCQGYSRSTCGNLAARARYPRLIGPARAALEETGRPWIIENVEQAASELVDPILLCGRMFGLTAEDEDGQPLVLERHRLFESNLDLVAPPHPAHAGPEWVAGVYGGARRAKRPTIGATPAPWQDRHAARYERKGGYVPRSRRVREALMGGVSWMTVKGLEESIPPAYSEYLGRQALEVIA